MRENHVSLFLPVCVCVCVFGRRSPFLLFVLFSHSSSSVCTCFCICVFPRFLSLLSLSHTNTLFSTRLPVNRTEA